MTEDEEFAAVFNAQLALDVIRAAARDKEEAEYRAGIEVELARIAADPTLSPAEKRSRSWDQVRGR